MNRAREKDTIETVIHLMQAVSEHGDTQVYDVQAHNAQAHACQALCSMTRFHDANQSRGH
jgi:hypothetical protein